MKYSKEVHDRILVALSSRLPGKKLGNCPICGELKWNIASAFVAITTTVEPQQITLGPNAWPCVILYCTNCGNSHFLNLVVLGLQELLMPEEQVNRGVASEPTAEAPEK
jgi:formate dehydrogenase maturation protein FdhE